MVPKKRTNKNETEDEGGGPSNSLRNESTNKKQKINDNEQKSINVSENSRRILIWNVNGLRACLKKSGDKYLENSNADIILLQETKCNEFPAEIERMVGYDFKELCVSTQNKGGYAGVALLSREKPLNVIKGTGDKDFDHQARFIQAEYPEYYLIGVYMMNSGMKLENLARRHELENLVLEKLKDLDSKKPVIYCGDLNVAHNEIDLKNPDTNRNKSAGFTDQERNDFTRLLDAGFIDIWRRRNPDTVKYSFWSYKRNARANNIGWRLDYFVISERILDKVVDCDIHTEVHGSDHCPLTLSINI